MDHFGAGVLVLTFPMVILMHSFTTVYDCYIYARTGVNQESAEVAEKEEVQEEIRERFCSGLSGRKSSSTAGMPAFKLDLHEAS